MVKDKQEQTNVQIEPKKANQKKKKEKKRKEIIEFHIIIYSIRLNTKES